MRKTFRWAVANELIPSSILEALKAVAGLRQGRTKARETAPVLPVSDQAVEATLCFLSPTVRAMVQLQLLTGARPGEICIMRTGDIDRSKPVWVYTPISHKNSHRGQRRAIFIGSKGQSILTPFLQLDPVAYCFSPAQAERERRQAIHDHRKTPLRCGNRPGTNRRRKPKCAPGNCYTVCSYRAAIKRACELAFQPPAPLGKMQSESVRAWKRRLTPEQSAELRKWNATNGWHPHQLRHSRGTEIRRNFGIECAQSVLGHYMRESTHEQRAHRNLKNRRKLLRRKLKQMGIEPICYYRDVVSGTQLHNRPGLRRAIANARLLEWTNPDAVVVVVTDARNRFIRGKHYNGRADTDSPSARQIKILRKLTKGVILATLLDPDETFEEVRRYETNVPTMLGEKSGKKVGRPKKQCTADGQRSGWKKRIREDNIELARRLQSADVSKREIGRRLGVADSTIRAWLK